MEIYYVNSKNETAYLDRYPFKMLSDTSLFDYEWQYETKRNNRVKNIKKTTKTASVDPRLRLCNRKSGKTLLWQVLPAMLFL